MVGLKRCVFRINGAGEKLLYLEPMTEVTEIEI